MRGGPKIAAQPSEGVGRQLRSHLLPTVPVLAAGLFALLVLNACSTRAPASRCDNRPFASYEQGVQAVADYHDGAHHYMQLLIDGDYECAQYWFKRVLEVQPGHVEALLGLALANAGLGEMDDALDALDRSNEGGLQPSLVLMLPDDIAGGLTSSDGFLARYPQPLPIVVHGPMLGDVTPRSGELWLRTSTQARVTVSVYAPGNYAEVLQVADGNTYATEDLTARIPLKDLSPSTEYTYRIALNGLVQPGEWRFRTFPERGTARVVEIGFGGCARYIPPYERIWDTLASHDLQAFVFLGDNVYIDDPTSSSIQRYVYYRRQSRPEFRRFVAETPVYAVWDDHDFATNDSIGGADPAEPSWKPSVLRVFETNWVNPPSGGSLGEPGVWFKFSIGEIDVFALDGRYYRTEPTSPEPSMLGPIQKEWLLSELASSTATFKLIASPVPWADGANPEPDAWDAYGDERDEILGFVVEHEIPGVVLLSADRHRSDFWRVAHASGYEFLEFESSRLTSAAHHEMDAAEFSYNDKPSFGKLTFDFTVEDPTLKYSIISIDDELVFEYVVHASQLQPPPGP